MNVLAESRYRVFGSPTFSGNPVTLFETDALDDGGAILDAARRSRTEDNVFYTAEDCASVTARFFSSQAELWLCGHGLLALSSHLRARHVDGVCPVRSPCGSWQIVCDAQGPGVLMPAQRGSEIAGWTHWMKRALRIVGIEPARLYRCPNEVWVVLLREQHELLALDAESLAALPCEGARPGAVIAAVPLPDAGYGFRYFAPWHGKREDSGTGSAHCYLAPLLLESAAPVTALQFSPQGTAEMRVGLSGGVVALSGRVEACTAEAG